MQDDTALSRQGDFRPTEQAYDVQEALTEQVATQLSRYEVLRNREIPALNAMVRSNAVDAVHIKKNELIER